jgi:hypothetical protein
MAFNKTTSTESTTAGDYTWTKIEGEDGVTTYTWVKYGTNSSGAGLTDTYTAGTTLYIGMAFNKTTATESTIAGDYTWTKIEGSDSTVAGPRGYSIFTIEESTDSNVSAANVTNWVGTLNDSNANDIAGAVIALAADNYIRPNDRITVTDTSASKAGTRIYTGSATGTEAEADAADFSSLVTETFDGSVIVDGTLAAAKLTSGFVYTQALTVGGNDNTVFKVNTDGDIWSGHATESSAPFQVNNEGDLIATSATITGEITATSGDIGGWSIGGSNTTLEATGITIDSANKRILIED